MPEIKDFIYKNFGVDEKTFLEALIMSPSSQGYILGAVSELLLRRYLEKDFEVLRIKEKPRGSYTAKSSDVRGDFYMRRKGEKKDKWLVVESKGLKSNSEFRGSKLDSKEKVFNFLKSRAFPPKDKKVRAYDKGYTSYLRIKKAWELKNKGKKFPTFDWDKQFPGPESYNLGKIWKNEEELKDWVYSQKEELFSELAYRKIQGPIAILETHQPSNREGLITEIKQAAPLVIDFNIMAVDLFLRIKEHKFVFMNSDNISHSPTSPEHLYQNYIIDILVKDKKQSATISLPWYEDILECIKKTKPTPKKLDRSQLDDRELTRA